MTFAGMPYWIVVSQDAKGSECFLVLPGQWSYAERDAMRFPAKAMAEKYRKRNGGVLKEVRT